MRRLFTIALTMAFGAGCATNTSVPQTASDHPASPDAPASALPATASTLKNPERESSTSTASEPREQVDSARYVCLMHPEVTSNAPGKCPKCGMALILKDKKSGDRDGH